MTPVVDPQTGPRVAYTVKDGVVVGMSVQDGAVAAGLVPGQPLDAEAADLTVTRSESQMADFVSIVGTLPGDVPVSVLATVESVDVPELDARVILGSEVPFVVDVGAWGTC